jgi:hypothetical protein
MYFIFGLIGNGFYAARIQHISICNAETLV